MSIRIGIYGYGNLGKGIECAIKQNSDMELVAVFTRRDPKTVKTNTENLQVIKAEDVIEWKDKIDVMVLCGGSATDLPTQTPLLAKYFNVVDSFDTHAKIPEHFENVDKVAKENGKLALISAGWDPGMFSILRVLGESILPIGQSYTFWGKGVSQGHSDAIRRIDGVIDAKQYTIPNIDAINEVRNGNTPTLSTREKHMRECYVVVSDDADKNKIEKQIKEMPNYFADYDTTVHFIDMKELIKNHSGIPHGGFVLRSGKTGDNERNTHIIEYSLKLDSNPEFTSSVIIAYARGIYRMSSEGVTGAKTVLDIPPAYLSIKSGEQLRKELL